MLPFMQNMFHFFFFVDLFIFFSSSFGLLMLFMCWENFMFYIPICFNSVQILQIDWVTLNSKEVATFVPLLKFILRFVYRANAQLNEF